MTTLHANQQIISNLRDELDRLAANIQTQLNLAASRAAAIEIKTDAVENLKDGLLNRVLNERFEINQRLKYTNENQRRAEANSRQPMPLIKERRRNC